MPLVPAVAVADRAVHGWNPAGYAGLLGVAYEAAPKLAPPILAARLDTVLDAAERLVRRIPDARLSWVPPERERSVRDLAFHVFRLSLAFVDAMDAGRMPEAWLQESTPEEMREARALASYGALVRGRLAGWFEGTAEAEFARTVEVYYGPQSGHDLLERTTWHAAQHLRQLHALAERMGVAPLDPLPVEAFRGLPMPAALW